MGRRSFQLRIHAAPNPAASSHRSYGGAALRTFYGGNGVDTTEAVIAYLEENDDPFMANLFLLGDREDPKAQFITDWESPLSWPLYGTFQPGVTKRDKVDSK